jgi:hypothetical protein
MLLQEPVVRSFFSPIRVRRVFKHTNTTVATNDDDVSGICTWFSYAIYLLEFNALAVAHSWRMQLTSRCLINSAILKTDYIKRSKTPARGQKP